MSSGTANFPGVREVMGRYYGFAELVASGDEMYRAFKEQAIAYTMSPGLNIPLHLFTGGLSDHWRVADDDDDGTINVYATGGTTYPPFATLVNHLGEMVTFNPSPATSPEVGIEVPDDDTWYSIIVRAAWVTRGRGQLTLASGSAAVTGSGTAFARMVAKDDIPTGLFKQPTKIRIASGGSNDGDYQVKTIASETSITLASNAAATETVNEGDWYEIGYWYDGITPTSEAAYQRLVPEFELVDVVVSANDGEYTLCDVKRDSGATPECTFKDRRPESRRTPMPWFPERFLALHGACEVLNIGMGGIVDEYEGSYEIGAIRSSLESDAGEYVTALDVDGRYVYYATWDGAAAHLYRADRYLENPTEITLTTSTSEIVSLRADGVYLVIAYGQKVELFALVSLESQWLYDHGAAVYDVAITGDVVLLVGTTGTGTKHARAIGVSDGLQVWSYNHGAALYSVTTDCKNAYVGGAAGTGGDHIRALLCSDGSEVWSYTATHALDRGNALAVNRQALYYVTGHDYCGALGLVLGNEIATFTELNWQIMEKVCVDDRFVYLAIEDTGSGGADRRVVALDPTTLSPLWSTAVTTEGVAFTAIAADGVAVFAGLEANSSTDTIAARFVCHRGARACTRVGNDDRSFQRQLVVFPP